MFDLGLVNGKAFVGGKVADANIYVSKGKIAKVSGAREKAEKTIDCSGLLILPGAIDSHVHFREPGMEKKEDWKTGSGAAAAGGICTVIDMPNTKPPTTTVKLLEEKRKIAEKKSIVNFGLNFGASSENAAEMRKAKGIAGFKVYMGTTTGDLKIEGDTDILQAFRIAKAKGVPAAVHAEDEGLIRHYAALLKGRGDPLAYCDSRPVSVAVKGLERAIAQASIAKNHLHVCHVSSIEEVRLIAEAKKAGLKVTCEVCPHHMFMGRKDVEKLGNFVKMNPPLRGDRERHELLRALETGLIDIAASDHAPHLREEKMKGVWEAASGVPGVETMLPLLLNEVARGNMRLARLVEAVCEKPAAIFGFRKKGKIAKGFDADFTVVEFGKEWVIRDEGMHSKCGWTPYHGWKIRGKVEKTIVKGKLVFSS